MTIEDFIQSKNLPKFRQKQFDHAFYKDVVDSFAEISTWPKELRDELQESVEFNSLVSEKELISKNKNTIKVLLKRKVDDQRIEAVLMRHKDGRNTVCVSCMVGCPVNCSFCATGKMGFGGNLSAQEIIEQVMYFQRYLKRIGSERVTNIVFMGMGEPMLNLKEVLTAIEAFTSTDKMAMSTRRITISTSGYIPQFEKLVETGFRGRVAISLHAPNQELRAKMMPVAKIYSLDKLMATLDSYTEITNKRVSYEYIMIKNLNDQEVHARQLVELLANRLAHVNLIPYNPIAEVSFERSEKNQIEKFTDILDVFGVNFSIRGTMGDDVNAACGQLADRYNKRNVTKVIKI